MKQIRAILFFSIAMLIACAALHAVAEDDPYDGCYYPVCLDGKWGYMNDEGKIIIPPQWSMAGEFNGDTAWVSTEKPREYRYDWGGDYYFMQEYVYFDYTMGIINREGKYIVEPYYRIFEEDDIYKIHDPDGREGFYAKAAGYFFEPQDQYSIYSFQGPPLLAKLSDTSSPSGSLYGYINTATGEVQIPFQYANAYNNAYFINGYAVVVRGIYEEGNQYPIHANFELIDTAGNTVRFPDGIMPAYSVYENRVAVYKEAETEEEKERSLWGSLYGFSDLNGNITVPPIYGYAERYSEGLAAVCNADYQWGIVDLNGNVILEPCYRTVSDGWLNSFYYHHGYAVIEAESREDTVYESWIILDRQGNEVFHQDIQKGGPYFHLDPDVDENGLIVYTEWEKGNNKNSVSGLMRYDGTHITEPVYGLISALSEGLYLARSTDGLYGFINDAGETVIPFEYNDAKDFSNGLAMIVKGDQMGYINHDGETVFMGFIGAEDSQ